MEDEPHEVVKLLVARMESHPEEFRIGEGVFHQRWSHHVDIVQDNGSKADKAALNAKLRDILMDELHEQVMEELCNGEERRRKEREEQEYERNMTRALQQSSYAQANSALQQAYGNPANALGQYQNAMLGVGTTAPNMKLDVQGIVGQSPTNVWVDDQVLDASMVAKMKRMILGGK